MRKAGHGVLFWKNKDTESFGNPEPQQQLIERRTAVQFYFLRMRIRGINFASSSKTISIKRG